jgi:hypothetical protein
VPFSGMLLAVVEVGHGELLPDLLPDAASGTCVGACQADQPRNETPGRSLFSGSRHKPPDQLGLSSSPRPHRWPGIERRRWKPTSPTSPW